MFTACDNNSNDGELSLASAPSGSGAFYLVLLMRDDYEGYNDEDEDALSACFGSDGYQVIQALPDALMAPSAEEVYAKEREAKLLRAALQHLTDKQADVMELRYGLKNGRDYTQQEAADMLGISQPMVAKHEAAALKRLQAALVPHF